MPLQRLSISGYRSIRRLDLQLAQVNVVVGANGCGKTNLYKSVFLLAAAASGQLAKTLAQEGGIPSVAWAGARDRGPVRVELEVDFDGFAYQFSCGLVPQQQPPNDAFNLDPDVKEERAWLLEGKRRHLVLERKAHSAFLRDAEGNRVTFPAELWPNESVLAQLAEPHRFPVLSTVRSHFLAWRFYHHFRSDLDAPLRQPQVGIRTSVLSHDGQDLAAALLTIRDIGDGPVLAACLDEAFPGAELDVRTESGRFSFTLRMPGIQRPLDARELSDGTIRYLCLVAALLSPRPAPFLALNEPETSLHPDLLVPLARLIAKASRRSQILVTTHAVELARELEQLSGAKPIHLAKPRGATEIIEAGEDE